MDEMWLLLALLLALVVFMATPCPMAAQYITEDTCMFDEVPDPFPTLLTGFGRENIGPY